MKASILIFAQLFAVSMAYRTSKQRYEGLNKLERENLDPGSQNLITTPPTTLTFAPSYAPTNSTTHTHSQCHITYAGGKLGISALTLIVLAIAIYLLKVAKKRCEQNLTMSAILAETISVLESAQSSS